MAFAQLAAPEVVAAEVAVAVPEVVVAEVVVPEVVVAAPEVAVAAPAAATEAPELTIQGRVSVVTGPDGAVQVIFINPADASHGYKVDLVNGEGSSLSDKDGMVVKATGTDANRLFTIQTLTVVE